MTKYTIEDTTMGRIADSVRDLTFSDDTLTPVQIAETLEHTQLGIPIGVHNHMVGRKWVRPEGWPNLDGWDTSGWSTTSTASNFNGCYNLRKCSYYNLGRTSGGNSSSYSNPGYLGYQLTDFGGLGDIYITHSYRNCPLLTHESLVNILIALPEVTNSPDIQLGSYNLRKLTEDEISIATNKGWDVVA